jgi:ubiquinone/menaquinone biosynthesis C-methylase UbiE
MITTGHAQQVIAAFDSVAEVFEASLENDITRRLRRKIHAAIHSLIAPGASILDLNCGIGIDAVALAQDGYTVLGVDISPKMIGQAETRAARIGTRNARFHVASFEDLSWLGGRTFDLVLSNFGGLNCARTLDTVAKEIARAVRTGGCFVAVVMPPVCMWEIIAGIVRLKPKLAFRRLRENVDATGFPAGTFSVHYHPPGNLMRSFDRWFDVERRDGLSIFSPPPHATAFKRKYPRVSRWLERWDDVVARVPGFRSIGDHYMMVLRRRAS